MQRPKASRLSHGRDSLCGTQLLLRSQQRLQYRWASTRAGTAAVPFAVKRKDSVYLELARWWSINCTGLKMPQWGWPRAVYAPMWVFQFDVKFSSKLVRFYDRYGECGPSTMIYSGAQFPREMTEALKNDLSLAMPFRSSMLDLEPGEPPPDVEPYELYESTAWKLVKEQYVNKLVAEENGSPGSIAARDIEFTNIRSHRVLMPVWCVEYDWLFERFRVFVNGRTGQACGVQQFSPMAAFARLGTLDINQLALRYRSVKQLLQALQRVLPPQLVVGLLQGALFGVRPLLKLLLWPPFLVGSLLTVSAFSLRSLTAGHRAQRKTLAEWEEMRRREQEMQATMTDEWKFRPQGETAYERSHERSESQRRQREREEQQQQRERSQQQQARPREGDSGAAERARRQREADAARAASKKPRPPPVDPSDYYAVLGIAQSAGEEQVRSAFRLQLMRFHPDHQMEEGGLDEAACSERTRHIIAAYGVLRDANKRRMYDSSYRPSRR